MTTIIVVIVICSLLSASLTLTFVFRTLRTQKQKQSQRRTILTEGTSAQAVINSIQQTNVRIDDNPEVLLDLTVTKQDGLVLHTVVKTVIPIVHIPAFQKGNTVEVKYMTIDDEQKFEVVGAYVP
ncbi:hypothetical protein [Brevibacillus reuszeri]|uniref:hypothetical protein n=1 Tax=Brevibacillus reuszeri TaxID=54915 RepID=UPI000CCC7DF2|nr:hypothetical protein [Brevibacillus reuszeri]